MAMNFSALAFLHSRDGMAASAASSRYHRAVGRHVRGSGMTITLNHTIVPCRDKVAASRLFVRLFGLTGWGCRTV